MRKNQEPNITAQDTQLPPSVENPPAPRTNSIWRGAIMPYLATRISLVFVGLLADFYFLPLLKRNSVLPSVTANTRFPDALWLMWERFDSGFYTTLAQYGYWSASTLHTYSNWAFYPLFPMLIFLFAHLFGGSQHANRRYFILIPFAMLQAALMIFFVLGLPAIA